MKTWKPDTCECLVEEIYNGTQIVGGGQVLKKCPAHAALADNEIYGVLYSNPDGENKRKNQMLRILLGYEDVKDLGLEELKKFIIWALNNIKIKDPNKTDSGLILPK